MTNWGATGTIWLGAPVSAPLKTGQTTQYSSELDDGYYQKGRAKSYTVLTTGGYSGTSAIDLTHLSRSDVSFTAATKTITSTGQMGVFKAAGGETIVISGAGQAGNNGVFTTVSADANTVVTTEALTEEVAGATVTIKKREAHSNNCVLDNSTGLMWSRYVSDKMGTAGDGTMPWTGVVYDIFAYAAAANTASLGGYSDWRVPNLFEFMSLGTGETPSGNPDSTAFPTWADDNFHTSTTYPVTTTSDMIARLRTLNVTVGAKTAGAFLILVRGGV